MVRPSVRSIALRGLIVLVIALVPGWASAAPKVVVISLDGAQPDLVEEYLGSGVLNRNTGLGKRFLDIEPRQRRLKFFRVSPT